MSNDKVVPPVVQAPIGIMEDSGVRWFKQNPHAYPVGTKFYASAAESMLQAPIEPVRPDILEKLTYHRHERDDLTLDDCLEYLANGWRKIAGRPERALIMQITELLASQLVTTPIAATVPSEPVAYYFEYQDEDGTQRMYNGHNEFPCNSKGNPLYAAPSTATEQASDVRNASKQENSLVTKIMSSLSRIVTLPELHTDAAGRDYICRSSVVKEVLCIRDNLFAIRSLKTPASKGNAPVEPSKWLPIDSGDNKDGEMILVCLPRCMNLIIRARYNTVHKHWLTDYEGEGGVSRVTFFHDGDLWQPMPAAPTKAQP